MYQGTLGRLLNHSESFQVYEKLPAYWRKLLVLGSLAAVLLLASGVAWAATVAFAPAKNYAAGSEPARLVSADFDGDGNPDLATANGGFADHPVGADDVSVLLGR